MTKFRILISKTGDGYAKWRLRTSRGSVFLSEIEGFKNAFASSGMIIVVINAYFNWLPPIWFLGVIWLIQKGFEYFMGWLDEKHLHWWQAENRYKMMNTDPFMAELMKEVKETKQLLLKDTIWTIKK